MGSQPSHVSAPLWFQRSLCLYLDAEGSHSIEPSSCQPRAPHAAQRPHAEGSRLAHHGRPVTGSVPCQHLDRVTVCLGRASTLHGLHCPQKQLHGRLAHGHLNRKSSQTQEEPKRQKASGQEKGLWALARTQLDTWT